MEHHFNIEIAQRHGVNEAIFLSNMAFWLLHNKANDKNFHDGYYWTHNTVKAFLALYPYWTNQNLRTIIKSCFAQKLIIKGNYNKRKGDRTLWYTLSNEGLKLFPAIGKIDLSLIQETDHLLELTNEVECGLQGDDSKKTPVVPHLLESTKPFVRTNTALPDRKPDIKQKIKDKRYCPSDDELKSFEQFWSLYPRKQKRKAALQSWLKNKLHTKAHEITMHLMKRIETEWKNKSKTYIPHPTTFLNGDGWIDEIITNENVIPIKGNISQHNRNVNYVMEKLKNGN